MVLAPALSDTLLQAGRLMEGAADPWWVIASAAAALHGVEGLPVGDVDVLASERDARAALSRAGSAPFPPDPHPLFRSRVLGQVKTAPLPIEIMAGLRSDRATPGPRLRRSRASPLNLTGLASSSRRGRNWRRF